MLSSNKVKRNPFFWIPFVLSSEKGKRNPSFWIAFVLLQKKEKESITLNSFCAFFKGMHDLEFLFCFPQKKKEKGMSLFFVFFRKRAKGTHVSKLRFSFCCRKEKGNMPREFNFSFPGRSKYSKISWNFRIDLLIGRKVHTPGELLGRGNTLVQTFCHFVSTLWFCPFIHPHDSEIHDSRLSYQAHSKQFST